MQPSTSERSRQWEPWERHGAGDPYTDEGPTSTAVITRDWTVAENLSLGTETFMPEHLLYGVVPSALLDSHEFWQDEDDNRTQALPPRTTANAAP